MSRWYRAYVGTITDPKFGEVALVAGCSLAVVISTWHALLEDCADTNDAGRFETTARRIAVMLREPVATIEAVLAEMSAIGLVDDDSLTGWGKYRQRLADSVGRPPAAEWSAIRALIFARDDFTCSYCGERGGRLECDHIIPVARGGSNKLSNLTTACKRCNQSKHARTPQEMGWWP